MREQMFDMPSEWIDFNQKASDSVPLPKLESNLHGGCGCPHPRVQVSLLNTDDVGGGDAGTSPGGEDSHHL